MLALQNEFGILPSFSVVWELVLVPELFATHPRWDKYRNGERLETFIAIWHRYDIQAVIAGLIKE